MQHDLAQDVLQDTFIKAYNNFGQFKQDSKLYGKNIVNFLQLIIDKEANLNLNWEDDLVKGACITHNGEIINDRVKSILSPSMNN